MTKPLLQKRGNISKGRTIKIRGVNLLGIFQSNQRTTVSKIVSQIFCRIVTNNRLTVPIGWGEHHEAWPKLNEALRNDTPDYALILSWGILEKEVLSSKASRSLKKIGSGRNESICDIVSKRMNYSPSKKKMLIQSMKLRNKIAHGGTSGTDWKNVDAILTAAHDSHISLA